MKFFRQFPVTQTPSGEYLTNLLVRTNLLPSLTDNAALYYLYNTQDGDTPEIIASKYYNDPYRYWLMLYSNSMLDPQWDLSLSTKNFNAYMEKKYNVEAKANNQTVLEYTETTIKYYYKNITTKDSYTQTTTSNNYIVDYDTYVTIPLSQTFVNTFDDGFSVTTTISTHTQTIYEYELEQNENKRAIKLLNTIYARDMENELSSLLK